MLYAQIVGGKVFIIIDRPELPVFAPNIVFVECGAEVEPGWIYDGSEFTAPPVVPLDSRLNASNAEILILIGEDNYDSIYTAAHPVSGPRDTLALFFLAIIATEYTDISNDVFKSYLAQFVSDGIIAAEDKTRIEAGIGAGI